MQILVCSYENSNSMMAIKFCTCNDSYAVMVCAKIGCNLLKIYWIIAEQIFHTIGMVSKTCYWDALNMEWKGGQSVANYSYSEVSNFVAAYLLRGFATIGM